MKFYITLCLLICCSTSLVAKDIYYVCEPTSINYVASSNVKDTLILEIIDNRVFPESYKKERYTEELKNCLIKQIQSILPQSLVVESTAYIKKKNTKYTIIQIKVDKYHSVFHQGDPLWKGFCKFNVAFIPFNKDTTELTIENNEEKYNWFGKGSARTALLNAYENSMKSLIEEVVRYVNTNILF